jgi:hypothetical protein
MPQLPLALHLLVNLKEHPMMTLSRESRAEKTSSD